MEAKKNAQNGGETSPSNHDNKSTPRKSADKSPSGGGELFPNNDGFKPRIALPSHIEPTYYIGGGNGNAIIEEIMTDLGWRRIKEKGDDTYILKWCELKGSINYNTFKEGDQLANHIPNCNLLTNKLGLLNSLQEYSRVCMAMKKRVPKLDFIPETFRLDDPREREVFRDTWKEGEVWICKPTGRNQGKGIYLVKTKEEIDQIFSETDDRSQQAQQQNKPQKPMNRIIQRYIHNPLLLDKKKFDIRAYMLIGSTVPYLVLYHKGYIRLSIYEYEDNFDNLAIHLTNQFIQKKDPMYKDLKEDTVWSMDKFNDYINSKIASGEIDVPGVEKDWADEVLPTRMKQIMTYCFNAVKHRLQCKVGYFDLYGFDFMIDEAMKVWLIEVNVNPCLAINCEGLREVVPNMVKETIYIAIECFEKSRRGKPIMPLQSLQSFQVLHSGGNNGKRTGSPVRPHAGATGAPIQQRSRSMSPVRRPRSLSPNKEVSQDSMTRRGVLALRPGIKPPPTSTQIQGNRPGFTSGNQSQQPNASGTRSNQSQQPNVPGSRSNQSQQPNASGTRSNQSQQPNGSGTRSNQSQQPYASGSRSNQSQQPNGSGSKSNNNPGAANVQKTTDKQGTSAKTSPKITEKSSPKGSGSNSPTVEKVGEKSKEGNSDGEKSKSPRAGSKSPRESGTSQKPEAKSDPKSAQGSSQKAETKNSVSASTKGIGNEKSPVPKSGKSQETVVKTGKSQETVVKTGKSQGPVVKTGKSQERTSPKTTGSGEKPQTVKSAKADNPSNNSNNSKSADGRKSQGNGPSLKMTNVLKKKQSTSSTAEVENRGS